MTTALCFRSSRAPRERYPWWKKKKTILSLPEDQDGVSDFLRVMCLVIVLAQRRKKLVGAKRVLDYEIDSYCVFCITTIFLFYSRLVKLVDVVDSAQ